MNSVPRLSVVFSPYSSNLHSIYLRKKLDASAGENVDTVITSILKFFLQSLILFVIGFENNKFYVTRKNINAI